MIAFKGTTKTYASSTSQIHLTHSFSEEPVNGQSYELNGFIYTYSSGTNRLNAGLITENPETIKTIVFYDQLYDIPVLYIYINSLETYTGLEDIIAFDLSNPNNIIKNLSIKNLYMAHANVFPNDAKTMSVENYHFVAPYEASETNFDTFNSKSKIDEMQFDNTYYYNFNQLFFQTVVDEYNDRSTKAHNFILMNESSLKYTKVSLAKISALLGHSSIHTTFDFYLDVMEEKEKISSFMNNTYTSEETYDEQSIQSKELY